MKEVHMWTNKDWGVNAYYVSIGKDEDGRPCAGDIGIVPIAGMGRIYVTVNRFKRFRIEDGKCSDDYPYDNVLQYYPTFELAMQSKMRMDIMSRIKKYLSFSGCSRVKKMSLQDLDRLDRLLSEEDEE